MKLRARKDYICCICNEPIEKGSLYQFVTGREPRYDADERQIGVNYYQFRYHDREQDCITNPVCRHLDLHKWVKEKALDGPSLWLSKGYYPTGNVVCSECGIVCPDIGVNP